MDFRAYAKSEAGKNIEEVYDKTYNIASLDFFVNSNFWITDLLRWISIVDIL